MEVVSPVLNTSQTVSPTFAEFWEAISVHFLVIKSPSCGGHVHITPLNYTRKFSLEELRQIAFSTIVYEDHINSILPFQRRTNEYCPPNSTCSARLKAIFAAGKSSQAFQALGLAIKGIMTENELYSFMQVAGARPDHRRDRYALWNFQNVVPREGYSGTIEFRGGSQFTSTKGTLRWVSFVIGFVDLALKEVRNP
jgi:hypothetical protein